MKRTILNNLVLYFFVFVVIISCSIIKPHQNENTKTLSYKKLLNTVKENQFNYEWLRLKGDANIIFKGEEEKIKTNFRLRNDSLIWMNFSKSSFQLLTSLVGKDSLKALIKYPEKKYFSGTFSELQKMIGVDLTFNLIEDMLIGRMIGLEKVRKTNVQIKENKYFIELKNKDANLPQNDYSIKYWINSQLFKCDSVAVYAQRNETKMNITYNNWAKIDKQDFPMKVNFNYISLTDTISLEFNYKSPLKINEKQNFPFKISEKYTPLIIE